MGHNKPVIIEQIHDGRNKIYIVNYKDKTCIWKKPGKRHPRKSLKKQIERSELWREFGLSKVEIELYHNKKSIIKTYVKGITLNKLIDENRHFFSVNSKELKALKRFVELLAKSEHFIHDMKCANIVFDGDNFQIIDSGPIYKMENVKNEYREILYQKWSGLLDSSEQEYLRRFLNDVLN